MPGQENAWGHKDLKNKTKKKKEEGIQEEGFLKINIFSFLVIEYPLPLTSKGRTARASMVQCAV